MVVVVVEVYCVKEEGVSSPIAHFAGLLLALLLWPFVGSFDFSFLFAWCLEFWLGRPFGVQVCRTVPCLCLLHAVDLRHQRGQSD